MWPAANRENYSGKTTRYQSDVTGEEWRIIRPLLPRPRTTRPQSPPPWHSSTPHPSCCFHVAWRGQYEFRNRPSGATLDLNSFNQSIGSFGGAGSVTVGSAILTTGNDNANTIFFLD
jgi:hypothetical protein